jgi:nuclear pore complex protein Nup205
MADDEEGLVGLQSLHQDLEDLDRGHHMRNIDSLWARLETRVKEFRQLLDKPSKNEDSRKTVLSGTRIL